MHPALFAHGLANGWVECRLCAHYCRLKPGQTGLCRVRHNIAGQLLTSCYGRPVSVAIEPIEKKPLFHVLPGANTLSLGTWGCNLSCRYCINWRVSQRRAPMDQRQVPPEAIIDKALASGVQCIAFTYTEPTIFLEYALDIAPLARRAGLAVVAKSNGYMTPAVMKAFVPHLDAINIDLKGWQASAHAKMTGGSLQSVLENLRLAKQLGLWIEVSTLIAPGLSDQPEDLQAIAGFIANELGVDTPWHLRRFFPHYRMSSLTATSQACLRQAMEIGQGAGLRHVYCKDLAHEGGLDTYCPGCGSVLIARDAQGVVTQTEGACRKCDLPLAGTEITFEKS